MEKNKGWCWHVHHDKLLEYCYDYKRRVKFIKENKSADEIKTRLRLFRFVKGKLPAKLLKACEAYVKACEACVKACEAYVKACEARVKACEARDKACEACDKACEACDKAYEARELQIEALHAKECPNCPWDGKTIFPKKAE